MDVSERSGAGKAGFERISGADGFCEVRVGLGEPFVVEVHLDVVDGGFGGPGAVDAPLGEGDLFDEIGFSGPFGAVFGHIVGEDFIKGVGILVAEGEVRGGESVTEGVA